MVLSKTCLLLFGLILCAVLMAVLTQNYNDTLCVHVSDLVKIKRSGLPKLKSQLGKKNTLFPPKRYRGGYTHDNNINDLNVDEYNNIFKREYDEHESSFRDVTGGQIATCFFPYGRTF
jgi:hypothetical protein